jgi:poly(A) polymerase
MIFHDNAFGTSRDDAFRRDFTVNAIFYDPIDDKLVDHIGLGVSDLRDGIVRTIGDPALRFEEDPVRVLRAIKLVGQYGFTMEPETGRAVRASLDLILHASPSRLSLELEKILRNSYTGEILKAFHDYGFLRPYLPELDAVFETPQMDYALKLLALRGERIRSGIFRASLSTAVALVALPFAELELGGSGEPGGLWDYYLGVESDLRHIILRLFHPLVLTHRTSSDAVNNLLMQLRFRTHRRLHSCADRKGYPGAREFAIIQNLITWHIPDFEDSCPLPVRASGAPNRKRRRGHRGGRRGGNGSGNTDQAQTVHTASQAAESAEPAIESDSERDINA